MITKKKAQELINKGAVIIDVRDDMEYTEYHIPNAISIPISTIRYKINEIVKNKQSVIILYCKSGSRSRRAAQILVQLGYTNVCDVGSINNLK